MIRLPARNATGQPRSATAPSLAAETGAPEEKIDPNGGAIAIGHPLGASGIRLLLTAVNQLERTGGTYGLVTMCIRFGQATATIVERV